MYYCVRKVWGRFLQNLIFEVDRQDCVKLDAAALLHHKTREEGDGMESGQEETEVLRLVNSRSPDSTSSEEEGEEDEIEGTDDSKEPETEILVFEDGIQIPFPEYKNNTNSSAEITKESVSTEIALYSPYVMPPLSANLREDQLVPLLPLSWVPGVAQSMGSVLPEPRPSPSLAVLRPGTPGSCCDGPLPALLLGNPPFCVV